MSVTRYRVREKNTKNAMGTVWGENLTLTEALQLKEKVSGTNASRTARVEPMDAEQAPIMDPQIVEARAKAKRAAAVAAQQAQARADAVQKAGKVRLVETAVMPGAHGAPKLAPVPAFDPNDLDDIADTSDNVTQEELDDLLGEIPPVTGG